ncbi:cobaltochelatase subunit CobN [Sphingomonas hengshuiensis]|uniref:Cobalt chelatase n=1 Tax=Sphingomonas hengshuiensis TaxID=1609977 RepID=A0A7U4J6U1_9SPHN|nr:cobaltochelatase subunit CobN [Sphingomonas hengshuiensis]AJP71314.1 cobalt chelatase [Sphingomonas hengshuiensis]
MRAIAALLLLLSGLILPASVQAQATRSRIAFVSIHIAEMPTIARAAAKRVEGSMAIDFFGLGGGLLPSIEGVDLGTYDLVLIDAAGPRLLNFSAQIEAAKKRTKVLVVGAGTPITGTVDPASHPDVARYWDNATEDNYGGLFAYAGSRLLGLPIPVPAPKVFPELALWHPEAKAPFARLSDYLAWETGRLPDAATRPRVGILFYRSLVLANNAAVVSALILEIEKQGGMPVPIWREGGRDLASSLLGGERLDALILCANRIDYADARAGVAEAARLGVPPLMCATDYRRTPEAWRDSLGGFAPEQTGELALSELEGIVEPMVVGARAVAPDGAVGYAALPDQVRWRVARAMAWARLHRLPNAEKRIVIPYHNEEPGEADVGSDPDSYMDAQGSIAALLTRLRAEGYDVGPDPIPDVATLSKRMAETGSSTRTGDRTALRARIAQGAITIPLATYLDWYATLPDEVRRATEARWGLPPGRIMTVDGQIVIPALRFGKVTLVAHPIWGIQADAGALAAKGALPPHHQYLAFHLWMQKGEHADAYLPMFTQLSLMPGKQEGPAADDAVAVLIGALPHIQPLPLQANGGVGNKRRTHAVTIGFMPEIVRAGLNPDLAAIAKLLGGQPLDQQAIRDAANRAGIGEALDFDPASAPWTAIEPALRRYLREAAAAPMPVGGHILGQAPDPVTTARLVQAMLAGNGGAAPDLVAVTRLLAGDDAALAPARATQARDYAARLAQAPREIDAIIAALSGGYVAPGPMQDAIRNPDALPAGRNPYTLDVRAIPTPAAWQAGARLADDMIAQHRARTGKPPRKVAFVLWSGETAQNGGTSEAQIFRLLGVRPVWNSRGQVVDVALEPRAALGRSRVDVLVTTSGTYRDHFGDKLGLIARAIALVSAAEEPDNPIRAETRARIAALRRAGVPADVAERRALRRIFSTAPGAYSPSTQFANREGWSPERLNRLYEARLGHAYGDGIDGEADSTAFAANLERVDAAIFSRSSSAYGLLDTPMPAAYLGGLAMAVRQRTGRNIETYVANGQVAGDVRIETLSRFYARERDSRYLNPEWIKGMQASGYNGARYMADLTDSMSLWEATKPDLVTDRDWEAVRDVYLRDRYNLGLDRFFAEANPAARAKLVAAMRDAVERGDWHADTATRLELGMGTVAAAPVPGTASVARASRMSGANAGSRKARARAGRASPSKSVSGFELVPQPRVSTQQPVRGSSTGLWMALAGLLVLCCMGLSTRPRW